MQIFVKTLTGKTITLEVDTSDTIQTVKDQLAVKEGVPVQEQRLNSGGKALDDSMTVYDSDIQPDYTVNMGLNLNGGGGPTGAGGSIQGGKETGIRSAGTRNFGPRTMGQLTETRRRPLSRYDPPST
jgi:ubiquitin-large subunit ribosomal protein L40e